MGSLAVNFNCPAFGYIETRLAQEISGRCDDQPPMKPLAASCSSDSRSQTMSRDRFVSGGQAIKSPVDSGASDVLRQEGTVKNATTNANTAITQKVSKWASVDACCLA
jgi:hypothetical protein